MKDFSRGTCKDTEQTFPQTARSKKVNGRNKCSEKKTTFKDCRPESRSSKDCISCFVQFKKKKSFRLSKEQEN